MSPRGRAVAASLAAAFLGALVYSGTLEAGFLTYDDPVLILEPEVVRAPSARAVVATLTEPIAGSYHPLHILSYGLDSVLYGLDRPGGFHATNVLLFALVCALVVPAARRFGASERGAALAGLLYAVHPSHVESVAWLSERKDVLSGALVLLALLATPRSDAPWRRWAMPFVLFLAALTSKVSAVALAPFLVVEAWIDGRRSGRTLARIAPLLLLSAFWLWIEVHALDRFGYIRPHASDSLGYRVRLVAATLAWYPVRLVAPWPLSPRPELAVGIVAGRADALSVLILAGAAGAFLVGLRRNALVARGVVWFFLALGPISNVVAHTTQVQDRYLFLPSIAAAALLGELAARVGSRARGRRLGVVAVLGLVTVLGAVTTVRYARAWRTDRELWEWSVRFDPRNVLCRLGLAGVLATAGETERADEEARRAHEVGGGALATAFRCSIAESRGRADEARALADEAWRESRCPETGAVVVRFALARGDVRAASEVVAALRSLAPEHGLTALSGARLAHLTGDLDAAAIDYRRAGERRLGDGWLGLAQVERARGRLDEAARALELASKTNGPRVGVLDESAALALIRGEPATAERLLREALALSPDDARSGHWLGRALANQGRYDESARELELVWRRTGDPAVAYDLARTLALSGRPGEARTWLGRAKASRADLGAEAARDPLLRDLAGE